MDYIELEVEKILWHTLCEILGTPLVNTINCHVCPQNGRHLRNSSGAPRMAAVCVCLEYYMQTIERTTCTIVCLCGCLLAIYYMSRHIKHGDQTYEMDLCVLLCGIHETIILYILYAILLLFCVLFCCIHETSNIITSLCAILLLVLHYTCCMLHNTILLGL